MRPSWGPSPPLPKKSTFAQNIIGNPLVQRIGRIVNIHGHPDLVRGLRRPDGACLRPESTVLFAGYLRACLWIDRQRNAGGFCLGEQRIHSGHEIVDVFAPLVGQVGAVLPGSNDVTWTDHHSVPGRDTAEIQPNRP